MSKQWTPEEIKFLKKYKNGAPKEAWEDFTEMFGGKRTYDSIQKKLVAIRETVSSIENEMDREEEVPFPDVTFPIVQIDPILKAEAKEDQKNFIEDLVEIVKTHKYPPAQTVKPISNGGSSLVLMLSDLHIGQQYRNLFNLDIAEKRILSMPGLLFSDFQNENIDEVVVLMMGDMVEGEDIFPTQQWHSMCSVRDQLLVASRVLMEMLMNLEREFDVPVRVVCVPGNHGRVSKTTNEKTNWDNILYMILGVMCENLYGKISIETTGDFFLSFKVKDKTGIINHEAVKHTGTPSTREHVAGWVYSKRAQFVCGGHYHEWKIGSWQDALCFCNGSLVGPNDLSERMAQESPARQGYFLVRAGQPISHIGFLQF